MLKRKEQKKNVAAGIGDASGRLPSKPAKEVAMIKCTNCNLELRATKTNSEAKAHYESKHPKVWIQNKRDVHMTLCVCS